MAGDSIVRKGNLLFVSFLFRKVAPMRKCVHYKPAQVWISFCPARAMLYKINLQPPSTPFNINKATIQIEGSWWAYFTGFLWLGVMTVKTGALEGVFDVFVLLSVGSGSPLYALMS